VDTKTAPPRWTVLFCLLEVLVPAEGLAQYPEHYCYGDKEQAEPYWATPAKPRAPRTPVFEVVFVAPAGLFLNVFEVFAMLLHGVPLLIDESLSPSRFDDTSCWRKRTHSL